jgi:predicted TIM-barrel fold metal-dependent hydrolase
MIMDIHTHLGDALNPGGKHLIEMISVKKKWIFDPISISESVLYADFGFNRFIYRLIGSQFVIAERERILTGTRQNMHMAMDEAGVSFCAVMPIYPYITFNDLREASEKDSRILAFTGADFGRPEEFRAAFARDVAAGAKGLKLHPILQRVPLNDRLTFAAVEAFAPHGLPVLFHCGYASYYLGAEKERERPEYGHPRYARELVAAFPDVTFIAGHAGMFEVGDVIEMLAGFRNVRVDVSFRPPDSIKELISVFGPERVLYGSDWPCGSMTAMIKAVKVACGGDKALERRIFYENAAEMMKMK